MLLSGGVHHWGYNTSKSPAFAATLEWKIWLTLWQIRTDHSKHVWDMRWYDKSLNCHTNVGWICLINCGLIRQIWIILSRHGQPVLCTANLVWVLFHSGVWLQKEVFQRPMAAGGFLSSWQTWYMIGIFHVNTTSCHTELPNPRMHDSSLNITDLNSVYKTHKGLENVGFFVICVSSPMTGNTVTNWL